MKTLVGAAYADDEIAVEDLIHTDIILHHGVNVGVAAKFASGTRETHDGTWWVWLKPSVGKPEWVHWNGKFKVTPVLLAKRSNGEERD